MIAELIYTYCVLQKEKKEARAVALKRVRVWLLLIYKRFLILSHVVGVAVLVSVGNSLESQRELWEAEGLAFSCLFPPTMPVRKRCQPKQR